eukprot:14734-Heterococcus_DN1.PRE.2
MSLPDALLQTLAQPLKPHCEPLTETLKFAKLKLDQFPKVQGKFDRTPTEAISTPEGARTCELLKLENNQNCMGFKRQRGGIQSTAASESEVEGSTAESNGDSKRVACERVY